MLRYAYRNNKIKYLSDMAKQDTGYMGGFRGSLGPAVGYQWNGKWCVRSKPGYMTNPRSAKQMEHRAMFRQQVQLAARMRWGVTTGLTAVAREAGMTAFNLFVSINQQAFSLVDGQMAVQWSELQLSGGPVAPVAAGQVQVEAGNVLKATFVKNPHHLPANNYDRVYLYLYSPLLEEGFLAAAVYRREQRVGVSLPDYFAGQALQLYYMVEDDRGRFSPTVYGGEVILAETAISTAAPTVSEPEHAPVPVAVAGPVATAAEPTAEAAPPEPPSPGGQLSLW